METIAKPNIFLFLVAIFCYINIMVAKVLCDHINNVACFRENEELPRIIERGDPITVYQFDQSILTGLLRTLGPLRSFGGLLFFEDFWFFEEFCFYLTFGPF
jgi:hypothetical protein